MYVQFDLQEKEEDVENMAKYFKEVTFNYYLKHSIDNEYYKVIYENKFVGFIHLYQKTLFRKFFLFPEYRHIGLGKKILKEAIIFFSDKLDAKEAHFFIRKENMRAINFFVKYGFIVDGEKDNHIKFIKG